MNPVRVNALSVFLILFCCWTSPIAAADDAQANMDITLQLIKEWVHGNYNNQWQTEADIAAELPAEQIHRTMHQLFVPIELDQFDGYLVYQQSSLDGSTDPTLVFRAGILQFFADSDNGVVRQRELNFKDVKTWANSHLDAGKLATLSADDVKWDAGCDFFLTTNKDNAEVSGPIRDGACKIYNPGLQKDLIADDFVVITSTHYKFRGRYRDADGTILWGTTSEELNSLKRIAAVSTQQ